MAQRQIPAGKTLQKKLESPPLQSIDKVIDIPVVLQRQACRPDVSEDAGVSAVTVHRQGGRCPRRASAQEPVEKTIEFHGLQIVEKGLLESLKSRLLRARPLRGWAPHLSAHWYRQRLWKLSRSQRLCPQSPRHSFFRHLPDVSEDSRDSTVAVHRQVVQVPQVQVVEKTIEISRFGDCGVSAAAVHRQGHRHPVVLQGQFPIVQTIQKTIEISQLQYTDKVFAVTVTQVYMFHRCRLWRRQSRFHGLEIVENIVELPEIQAVQTSESLFSYSAPVRRLTLAEIVKVCRDRSSSARRIHVNHVRHGTRLKSSASCCGACRPSCYPFPSRTRCRRSFMC